MLSAKLVKTRGGGMYYGDDTTKIEIRLHLEKLF